MPGGEVRTGAVKTKGGGGETGLDEGRSGTLYLEWFLYALFTLVVSASILVVGYGIASGYAVLQAPPAVLYILLLLTLILLGYVEALHYSHVSIERYDMTPYAER
jgi:hypothetical protein